MKNEHNLFIASLAKRVALLALVPVFLSCGKEDLPPQGIEQFLYNKRWRLELVTVTERDKEVPEPILACQQDDALEYKVDSLLLYHNGQNKCSNEPDVESGSWGFDVEGKLLTMNGQPYYVNSLSATRMELQRELRGVNGSVTVKSFYWAE